MVYYQQPFMASLLLKIHPDSVLRRKAEPIKAIELHKPELQQLFLDMEQTMDDNDGIGLAAPQVGKSIQLAVIKTKDGALALANPKITRFSLRQEFGEEGCLSIPGVYGSVKRSRTIRVRALDRRGKKLNFKASGLFARVIQHEIDHLNGILFIDKAVEITMGKDILAFTEKSKN